eukprot:3019216-Amphidinium_carterae.1
MPAAQAANGSDVGDLLEELMTLHRQEMAAREPVTEAPMDLPDAANSDYLVATMADGGYAACAVRLVQSVRGIGRWAGDVVVL